MCPAQYPRHNRQLQQQQQQQQSSTQVSPSGSPMSKHAQQVIAMNQALAGRKKESMLKILRAHRDPDLSLPESVIGVDADDTIILPPDPLITKYVICVDYKCLLSSHGGINVVLGYSFEALKTNKAREKRLVDERHWNMNFEQRLAALEVSSSPKEGL
jgi:hypothetical protein